MFYSQTFLARKGPLGTVWCAAHLQHRLKKSHYTSTDISSAIDRIMFPEVPIALRMSGHLLLGVVRIYSKKVEYLFHDCNVVRTALRKVFTTVDVRLPGEADQAPSEAITLPERFDLDTLELHEDSYDDRANNQHLTTREEITIQDQIPSQKDPYATATFDDDVIMEDAPAFDSNNEVQNAMVESGIPQPESDRTAQIPARINEGVASTPLHDMPENQELDQGVNVHDEMPTPAPMETLRAVPHELGPENPSIGLLNEGNDINIERQTLEGTTNEGIPSPQINSRMASIGQYSVVTRSKSRMSIASSQAPELPIDFPSREMSPGLGVILQSPPVQHQKVRVRKRNMRFDKSTVLSNKYMKISLDRPDDLVRERRQVPSSSLEVWALNNVTRKEQVFQQPSFPGLSTDFATINPAYIKSKPDLIFHDIADANRTELSPQNTPVQEPTVTHTGVEEGRENESHFDTSYHDDNSVLPSTPPMEFDIEMERLRHAEEQLPAESSAIRGMFSSISKVLDTSTRRDDPTPATSFDNELIRTPKSVVTSGTTSQLETPFVPSVDVRGLKGSGLPDIPEMSNVEDADELFYIGADSATPTKGGSRQRQDVASLSGRTRAVAEYLKKQSPTPLDAPGRLSLNKILEGRTRKVCARMFFETLVLKSYGLLDVHQEEPYGDIQLHLTSTLSKAF